MGYHTVFKRKTYTAFAAISGMVAGGILLATQGAYALEHGQKRWPQWYIGASAGFSWQDDTSVGSMGELSFDDGTGFAAALGYRPALNGDARGLRIELEYMHNRNDIDAMTAGGVPTLLSGDLTTRAGMLNLFYDFHNSSRFTPYLGLGGGWADVKLSGNGLNGDDTVFAYQFQGGVSYSPMTIPFVDIGLGYRFFQSDDAEILPGTELENRAHNAEVNVRFNF